MIRTEEDMKWVQAMQAAGYTFAPVNVVGQAQLYYGDLLYADLNGDGVYGDSNDREFSGKSPLPKYNYGFNVDLEWKNFDFSMIWAGSAGMHYYFLETSYNASNISSRNAISAQVANDRYYYNATNPADPANRINGAYPRLTYQTTAINREMSDRWIYNASYLKLKKYPVRVYHPVPYRGTV